MRPLCGLSEACLLSSYGLPKATLGILARVQTLVRASPQPCPLLGSWQACLFSSYGLPKATLGILARLQTLPRASPQPCPLLGRLPKATFRHFGPPSKAFRPLAASLWPVRSFSAAGRPLAASLWPVRSLPPLFLWASEGNVRHFGPASKASRQPAGLLRPLCGLSEACLLSSYGLPKAFWTGFKSLSAAGRPLAASLWPVRSLPPLFLWASEGNVRHFGPASKASRQPAGLLPPLCRLSEACLLSSYGLPKATLGILARVQTLVRASPQPCPLLGSWQACIFSSYGLPKATLGILARLQTLPRASPQRCPLVGRLRKATFRHFGPPSKAFRPLAASLWPVRSFSAAGRPLAASLWPVRSWASEGNVRHFGPASKASRQPAGLLPPLCGLSEACLLYGLPKATLFKSLSAACRPFAASLWPFRGLPPLFLWASEGNVRHFGSASNAPQSLTAALPSSRQLAGLPLLFFWASEGNVRHFGSASNAPQSLAAALPSSRQASEGDV